MTPRRWIKSSRSGNSGGNCVEVGTLGGNDNPVCVRDSKAPALGSLAVPRDEFRRLLRAVG